MRLAGAVGQNNLFGMSNSNFRSFCYPAEVIQHAVPLHHCLSLTLRDGETILAACGIVVTYGSSRG